MPSLLIGNRASIEFIFVFRLCYSERVLFHSAVIHAIGCRLALAYKIIVCLFCIATIVPTRSSAIKAACRTEEVELITGPRSVVSSPKPRRR